MTTPDTASYGWSRCHSCGTRLDHVAEGRPACLYCDPLGLLGPLVDPLVPFGSTSEEDGGFAALKAENNRLTEVLTAATVDQALLENSRQTAELALTAASELLAENARLKTELAELTTPIPTPESGPPVADSEPIP